MSNEQYILGYANAVSRFRGLMSKEAANKNFRFGQYQFMYAPNQNARYMIIPENNKELVAWKSGDRDKILSEYNKKLEKLDKAVSEQQRQFDAIPRTEDVKWHRRLPVALDTWWRGMALERAQKKRDVYAAKHNPSYKLRASLARDMASKAYYGGMTAPEYMEYRRLHPKARAVRFAPGGASTYDQAYQQLVTLLPENIPELAGV